MAVDSFKFTWIRNILISVVLYIARILKIEKKMLYHNFRAPANWADEFMLFFLMLRTHISFTDRNILEDSY